MSDVRLTDHDFGRLNDGYSVQKWDSDGKSVLITFEKGSKRYVDIKD